MTVFSEMNPHMYTLNSLSTPEFDDYLTELGFTLGERWRRPKLARWRLRLARWLLHVLDITAVPTPAQLAEIDAAEVADRAAHPENYTSLFD